jgi:hypothetical protein
MSNLNSVAADEQTKSGYLVRAFFCSIIGLHRSYMGTKGLRSEGIIRYWAVSKAILA